MRVKLVRDEIGRGLPRMSFTKKQDVYAQPANSVPGKVLALALKLHEESAEIVADPTNPEEYADLLEVMIEMARINGVSWRDITLEAQKKRDAKGGFRRGYVMVEGEP